MTNYYFNMRLLQTLFTRYFVDLFIVFKIWNAFSIRACLYLCGFSPEIFRQYFEFINFSCKINSQMLSCLKQSFNFSIRRLLRVFAAPGLAEDPLCMFTVLLELLPVLSLLEDP